LIFYRPPQSNVKAGGPVVGQVDGQVAPRPLDLRRRRDAKALEKALTAIDLTELC
jgi:hypothetical protein